MDKNKLEMDMIRKSFELINPIYTQAFKIMEFNICGIPIVINKMELTLNDIDTYEKFYEVLLVVNYKFKYKDEELTYKGFIKIERPIISVCDLNKELLYKISRIIENIEDKLLLLNLKM